MKTIFISLSLISFLFLASSCPKNDGGPNNSNQQLPAATQTGANTLGCDVNGQVWLPNRNNGPSLQVQYYKGLFLLSAANQKSNQSISWAYKSIFGVGTYYFKSAPGGGEPGAGFSNGTSNCTFESDNRDSLNTYVTITKLDSVKKIISGTFNLIYSPSINETYGNCDTLKITNGRFDAIYTF